MILEPQGSTSLATYYQGYKYSSIQQLHKFGDMHGVKRVLIFCLMMAILPMVLIITPLYLRHSAYADVGYQVAESDVLAILDGVSSVFCSSHSLRMNSTFNAFQLRSTPKLSAKRKHLRLKKSMTLPDDTLEYWGFYLLENATVSLKVCARYPGSRLLVVRGDKNLQTCGLMDHNMKKIGAMLDKDHKQVKVIFEDQEEMDPGSDESKKVNVTEKKEPKQANEFVKKRLDKAKNKTKAIPESLPIARQLNLQTAALRLDSFENTIDIDDQSKIRQHLRHNSRKRIEMEIERLQAQLDHSDETFPDDIDKEEVDNVEIRKKRDLNQMLDGGIEHGGNAINFSQRDSTVNSVSSFEEDLLTCYDGSILLAQGFDPSDSCTSVHYLEEGKHMETVHEVASDGYYYYIFYSDNDIENNMIHAVFDVFKPTYQYMNNTKDKECINVTECNFPIRFLSDETVIVEVPTHDGIEVDEEHVYTLISTCHPRMGIYIIFPVSVMLLILGCGFL